MKLEEIKKRIKELKAKKDLTQEEKEELEYLKNAKEGYDQLISIY